ncbi:MAG: LPS-assembly protein LptD [Armatimonadota bacterium]
MLHKVLVSLCVWLSISVVTFAQITDTVPSQTEPAPVVTNPVLAKIGNEFRTASTIVALDPNNPALLAYSAVCDAISTALSPITEPVQTAANQTTEPPAAKNIEIKSFKSLEITPDNKLDATGIVALWREHTIKADKVTGDTGQREYTFNGGVDVSAEGLSLKSDDLTINTRYRDWSSTGAHGSASPEYMETDVIKENLLFKGATMTGDQRTAHLSACLLTTCDREHPHYVIDTAYADIIKGRSLTLRDLRIKLWGRTLVKVPKLVIPLDREYDPDYIPQVGNTPDEGYFVKMAIGYSLIQQEGKALVQLMQKKGVGLGFDQPYEFGKNKGTLSVFGLVNQSQSSKYITASLQHTTQLFGLNTQITGDLRQNSYMLGNDSSSNLSLNLDKSTRGTEFRSNTRYGSQNSDYYDSNSYAQSLAYGFRWGRQSLRFSTDYTKTDNSYGSGSSSSSERLTGGIDGSGTLGSFDWGLAVNRFFPMGDDQNSVIYGGLEKLPELSFRTDSMKLWKQQSGLSFKTVLGRYSQMQNGDQINRAMVEAAWNPRWGTGTGINYTASSLFRQIISSDNTAEYVLQGSFGVTKPIREGLAWRANYQYTRPYGYSPLTLDYTGKSSYATVGMEYSVADRIKIRAGSGYDFFAELRQSQPWQPLAFEAMWKPSSASQIAVSSSLDPNSGRWDSMRTIVRYQSKKFSTNISALYNPLTNQLATGNAYVETSLFNGGWRVSGLLNYNGYLDQFDSQQYQIVRDMHCMEAVISMTDIQTGFTVGKQWMFQLRLKALGRTPKLGKGSYGESLMSSGGGFGY